MKNLLLACLATLPAFTAAAQLDEHYYGRYTDNKDLTGYEVMPLEESFDNYCFMVSKDRYDEFGQSIHSVFGFARCAMTDGKYAVELESDEPNLWLVFETDQFGNKTVTATEQDQVSETFFYNPLEEEVYTEDVSEEEIPADNSGEPSAYLREDGTGFFVGEIDGEQQFMLLGSDESNPCSELDGTLEIVDAAAGTWICKVGDCVLLTVTMAGDKAVIVEQSCKGVRKKCASFSGTYSLVDE